MHADADDNTCPWGIRDRHGWQHSVLFTASADFLVAWYTASASTPRRTWATANLRFGALVQRVRQMRLGGNVDGTGAGLPEPAPGGYQGERLAQLGERNWIPLC